MGEELTPEQVLAREIAAEQDYVDEVYVQLEASTQSAMALAQEGRNRGRLEHEGGLVERDAMVFQAAKRIAQLDAAPEGRVFGRLDRVVPSSVTRRYLQMWPHAVGVTLARTGHLGLITRPDEFARLVAGFAEGGVEDDRRRLVG